MRKPLLILLLFVFMSSAFAQDLTHLPFGDSLILRRDQGKQPGVQKLWLCGVPPDGAGSSDATDWTNSDGTWDFTRKPKVEGRVSWNSQFSVTLDGNGNRIITGNALPSTPTGIFPINPGTAAYVYDRNPSHIEPHSVNYVFPAIPQVAQRPGCVPYGPSGISLTGNAIYHGASTLGSDAAAYEMLDTCGGQSDGTFTYHTHFITPCLLEVLDTAGPGHSSLMGYMLDGFGIYGPRGETGNILTYADLDPCHGHTHSILWDGQLLNLYHYHWTYDFPYNIGCYKGTRVVTTDVEETGSSMKNIPELQNFPNPFHATTRITFTVQNSGFTTLKVYDYLGRELNTPVQENLNSGTYDITYDGSGLEAGVYFYSLRQGESLLTRKFVMFK